ncbi:TetR/AcrR family transcriptional regulator [Clostridium sp. 19966]|uniref:TetR/AcrR family transcriptional regulator n=1 Tax=Clostridium sp. 19966 TaxID=2768166 RepID=UPI0028DD9A13|nr:TetR/AcrR family transcriptional regulator [Clostridium sp. 19966]MDT8718351.1 TetR/AcrR family transcriptional regulator [Clostridium sp. 19966]
MGINERREAEKKAIMDKIIKAASDILVREGYEKLSIRKIASEIEYSPGIIYHYFQDKNDILKQVIKEGYEDILAAISSVPEDISSPEETIRKRLRAYIDFMLQRPNHFKMLLISDIGEEQNNLNILHKGVAKERGTIFQLAEMIQNMVDKRIFRNVDAELTAQIIWTSTHGLISRLIMETHIEEEQKERLINHHFDILFNGLIIGYVLKEC